MDTTTETTTTTAGAGTTPGADSGTGGTQPALAADDRRFSQDDLNRLLAEDRRKADEKRKADAAREKQQREEAAAKERGEWEQVAQGVTAERDRLQSEREAIQAERDALAAEIEAEIKPRLKALPEELRDLVPADGTPAQRLAAVRKLELAATKLASQRTPGTPSGPRGTGGASAPLGGTDEQLRNEARARMGSF